MSVFISYRTCDQPWVAGWVCSELSARLGSDQVFLDSKSIPVGENFGGLLLRTVRASSVLLVIIGSEWYATNARGRLIDNPGDFVRMEIAAAFEAELRVIPVLVGEVAELCADDLPADIRRLAALQYVRVRSRDAHRDVPRVVDDIVAIACIGRRPRKPWRRRLSG